MVQKISMVQKIARKARKFKGASVGLALASGAAVSQAAVDVSAVTTEISGAAAPIAAIGGAVLVILVTAAVYKWVRKAL